MRPPLKHDLVMRVHRALCSPFVDQGLFLAAMGSGRGDIGNVGRYMALPLLRRPVLSVYFDREFYLATNPDVMDSGDDPLVHFVTSGFEGLRSPHPLIDLRYIRSEDPSVLGDPPDMQSLLDLLDYDLMASSPYFDLAWYAAELGASAPASGLLRHFLTECLAAGRQPLYWQLRRRG